MNAKTQQAVGMIELTSVGIGHLVQDAMLKAASVKLLLARTICSGKYIIIVCGDVAPVQASVTAGLDAAPDGIIDHFVIANAHPDVYAALGQSVQLNVSAGSYPSVGILETFSSASALEAADAAVKAANIKIFKIHVAMALGGKGLVMFAGSISDCRAALDAAVAVVKPKGLLVSAVTIPRPSRELFVDYI
ncbi:MAG: BMC domain-containing protein [Planctomycetes bacterium]|nr:BMC domain-containing protein [Planctomycetota bacterium]